MSIINAIFGKFIEIMLLPFRGMNPWAGMLVVSFVTGLLMLLIFRYTSNQEGIRRVKDRIKAHLLEMRLYSDNMRVSFRAQGSILRANFRYILLAAKPMLVMIIPVVLILVQLNFWFGYASLEPGRPTLLTVKLKESYNPMEIDVSLDSPPGIEVETPPLRIAEEHEIDWRISAREPGRYQLAVLVGKDRMVKTVTAGQTSLSRISPLRLKGGFLDRMLYPVEAPLDENLPVESIEIRYPSRSLRLLGMNVHWLVAFFVLSVIFGFAFKGVFGVEI